MIVSRRAFLAGSAATAGLVAVHPFTARAAADQAHLRILETTDLHVNVFPYDYYADKPNETFGLSRTATIIEGIKAEAGNTLLIDNGDIIQGSPMGDYVAYAHGMPDGYVHPHHSSHEHAGLRLRDAWEPRIQLRPRYSRPGHRRGEFPLRVRQPGSRVGSRPIP